MGFDGSLLGCLHLSILLTHWLARMWKGFHLVDGVDWTKTTSTKWEVAFSSNTLSFSYLFTTHNCTGLLQGFYVSNPCFPNQHVVRLTRRVVRQFVILSINAQNQATPNVRYYLTFWVNLIFLVTRIIRCTPTSLQLGISCVRLRVYKCTSKKK